MVNRQPWGVEYCSRTEVPGGTVWFNSFLVPEELPRFLIGVNVDPLFRTLAGLLYGTDYGDEVWGLVQRHWRATATAVRVGSSGSDQAGLVIVTINRDYWVYGGFYTNQSPTELQIPERFHHEVAAGAAGVCRELLGFPVDLPGLVQVLGGQDESTRRLKEVGDRVSTIKDWLDIAKGLGVS